MKTTTITIQGMHCPSCKALIEDASKDIAGVAECTVDFEKGAATITHDDDFDLTKIKREIEGLGDYQVTLP